MNNTEAIQVVSRVVQILPPLLVYLLAAILAFVFWSRCRTASILTLVAVVVMSVGTIAYPAMQAYLIHRHQEDGSSASEFSARMSVFGMAFTFVHMLGLSLLVAAVFVGRRRPTQPTPQPLVGHGL